MKLPVIGRTSATPQGNPALILRKANRTYLHENTGFLSDKFEVIFLSGDFNYRVNGTKEEILDKINQNKHHV